jgi:hypothetical protein
MVEREHFSREEAEAKVGRKIRTRVAWSGVPQGTTGAVVRADSAGLSKPSIGEVVETFDVGIQWDLPREPLQIRQGVIGDEPILMITGGRPLLDWFSKGEYEAYLDELDEEPIDRSQQGS